MLGPWTLIKLILMISLAMMIKEMMALCFFSHPQKTRMMMTAIMMMAAMAVIDEHMVMPRLSRLGG